MNNTVITKAEYPINIAEIDVPKIIQGTSKEPKAKQLLAIMHCLSSSINTRDINYPSEESDIKLYSTQIQNSPIFKRILKKENYDIQSATNIALALCIKFALEQTVNALGAYSTKTLNAIHERIYLLAIAIIEEKKLIDEINNEEAFSKIMIDEANHLFANFK